jgi:hypothetical protein
VRELLFFTLLFSATRENLREERDNTKRKRRKLEGWVAIMADTCTGEIILWRTVREERNEEEESVHENEGDGFHLYWIGRPRSTPFDHI